MKEERERREEEERKVGDDGKSADILCCHLLNISSDPLYEELSLYDLFSFVCQSLRFICREKVKTYFP